MARFEIAFVLLATVTACSSAPEPTTTTAPSASAPSATATSTKGLHDAATADQLRQASMELAVNAGVSAPATMRAVAAKSHRAAEAVISGADLADDSPVYVVQMTGGSFTATHARPGLAPYVGNVMTVTYDADTMRVTDIGFDEAPADLGRIDAEIVDLK